MKLSIAAARYNENETQYRKRRPLLFTASQLSYVRIALFRPPCSGGMEQERESERDPVQPFTNHVDWGKKTFYDTLIGNVEERGHGYGDDPITFFSTVLTKAGVNVTLVVPNDKAYRIYQLMEDAEPTLRKQMKGVPPGHKHFGFVDHEQCEAYAIFLLASGCSVCLNSKKRKDPMAADTSTKFAINEAVAAFFPIRAKSPEDLDIPARWFSCSAAPDGIVITIKLSKEPFGWRHHSNFTPPKLDEVRVDLCLHQYYMECVQANAEAPPPFLFSVLTPSPSLANRPSSTSL